MENASVSSTELENAFCHSTPQDQLYIWFSAVRVFEFTYAN